MAKVHIYVLSPIDYWLGWMKEADYLASAKDYDDMIGNTFVDDYKALKLKAFAQAKSVGWEGDIREGPYVTGLPSDSGEVYVMLGWKQDNNGTTFIASPVQLSNLKTQLATTA